MPDGLPFRIEDYLEMVELTGRHFHSDKKGNIADSAPSILTRVGLDRADWHIMVSGIETEFKVTVSAERLILRKKRNRQCRSA